MLRGGELAALGHTPAPRPASERRLGLLASVQFAAASAKRRERTHKQRHKLGRLPKDWLLRVHRKSKAGIYGAAIALGILIPVRPSEIANRVDVKLDASGALTFEIKGSKVQAKGSGVAAHVNGIGQPVRWLTLSAVDPARQEVFDWLRELVRAGNGKLSIGNGLSARAISSAFRSTSRTVFKSNSAPPSFYLLRHAACSELKAAHLDAEYIAFGMGHTSVASQKAYGTRTQGSGGYVISTGALAAVRARPVRPRPCGRLTPKRGRCPS